MKPILFSSTLYFPLVRNQQGFQASRRLQTARNLASSPYQMRPTTNGKVKAETNHVSELLKNQKFAGDSFMRVNSVKPAQTHLLHFNGTSPYCDNPGCYDDHCNGSDCYDKYDDNYGDYGATGSYQDDDPKEAGDSGYEDWEQDEWDKWNEQSLAVNNGGFSRRQVESRDNFLGALEELEKAPVVGKFATRLKNHELAKGGPPFDEDFDEWLEGYNAPKG